MLDKVKVLVLAGVMMFAGVGVVALASGGAYAVNENIKKGICIAGGKEEGCEPSDEGTGSLTELVKSIINTILYIVGILAVVMIIYGGVQYTISAGDQGTVTKAKNTIIYGIVGLVIAILAYAIVAFVVSKL